MKEITGLAVVMLVMPVLLAACASRESEGTAVQKGDLEKWAIHDLSRPLPPVVDPGPAGPPVAPPSDAVVLFDGEDLSQWEDGNGGPAGWKVEDGYAEVVAKAGSIRTKKGFGDCQLHIEWATPVEVKGEGQERGNSGVFLMDTYEVQVLDSYDNTTYADGQAAAIYGQFPPLVNACRKPGEWQTYDVIFTAPAFEGGELAKPGAVTMLHNGVLVHNDTKLLGATGHRTAPSYTPHASRLPIVLQGHGSPVEYRSIWLRDLQPAE
jgi:hypothetical protein